MTPLWKHPEPDDRPSAAEMVFAGCMFLFVIVALFIMDLVRAVTP